MSLHAFIIVQEKDANTSPVPWAEAIPIKEKENARAECIAVVEEYNRRRPRNSKPYEFVRVTRFEDIIK